GGESLRHDLDATLRHERAARDLEPMHALRKPFGLAACAEYPRARLSVRERRRRLEALEIRGAALVLVNGRPTTIPLVFTAEKAAGQGEVESRPVPEVNRLERVQIHAIVGLRGVRDVRAEPGDLFGRDAVVVIACNARLQS